ncbi:hypothetical protein ACSQ67_023893 [Phaseolus vulgaris]
MTTTIAMELEIDFFICGIRRRPSFDTNISLITQNKDLAAELARLKVESDGLLSRCHDAKDKENGYLSR